MNTKDKILARVDLSSYVGRYVELHESGKDRKSVCPFCDKENAFTVSDSYQMYYCFSCQSSGNVIDFVKQIDKVNFDEAVAKLNENVCE